MLHRELRACDWDGPGILNSRDFFDFLNGVFSGDGDYNCGGGVNSQDVFDFINRLFSDF